jgi:glycosyltransferase involved in cell wall biosynthesis
MRALYISYDGIADPIGQSQILPILKILSRKGIEFSVLSFEKAHSQESINYVKNGLRNEGIFWKPLKYHKKPQVISTFFDMIQGLIFAAIISIRRNIRVIHCRSHIAIFIAIWLRAILGRKIIFDMRGYWMDDRIEAGIWPKNSWLYRFGKFLEKKLFIRNCDAIVTLTKNSLEDITQTWGVPKQAITYIPTCVDFDVFKQDAIKMSPLPDLNRIEQRFTFAYAGSLGTWYALEEMINFYLEAKRVFQDVFFLMLTPNPDVWSSEIKNFPIQPSDYSLINVPHFQVPHYLSMAKVGLAFYKPGYSRIACSPIKVGEYLASGLPVIINNGIGDTAEILRSERVGVVLEGFNLDSYKRAISGLSSLLEEGPELRQRCRAAAIKYFSLENCASEYLKIYQRLSN